MKRLVLAACLALISSPAAFADTSAGPSGPGLEQLRARRAERMSRELGLDAAGQQRLEAALGELAAQRRAAREQSRAQLDILQRAAHGDPAAASQVDGAIAQLRAARRDGALRAEQVFDGFAQGLNGQQKAKLALMLHRRGEGHHRWSRAHAAQDGQEP
jgi:hypothetical protein